jgi:hypothetical protein
MRQWGGDFYDSSYVDGTGWWKIGCRKIFAIDGFLPIAPWALPSPASTTGFAHCYLEQTQTTALSNWKFFLGYAFTCWCAIDQPMPPAIFEGLPAVFINLDVNIRWQKKNAMGKKRKKMGKFGNEMMNQRYPGINGRTTDSCQ